MPVYKARAFLRDSLLLGDTDYSWNFHVEDPGTADDAFDLASLHAANFVDVLCPVTVELYAVSIHNPDVVNGVQHRVVSTHGTRAVTGDALPGWNCARYQAATSLGGRVHTWFLKMGLTEDDVDGQVLVAGVQTIIGNFITAQQAIGGFTDKDGALFDVYFQDTLMHMRQMSWNRRVRPGYKRGYVPV